MSSEEPRERPRLNLKPRDEAAAAKAAQERAKTAKSVRGSSTTALNALCKVPSETEQHRARDEDIAMVSLNRIFCKQELCWL